LEKGLQEKKLGNLCFKKFILSKCLF